MIKNRKGFTLIELLAVITIMGVLMVVAIPTVSRTIENTRRDTFLDTAKQYVNGVKTMWMSDSLECQVEYGGSYSTASALSEGTYYVRINTTFDSGGPGTYYPTILESGGKSSWGNRDIKGYVKIVVEKDENSDIMTQTYSIRLTDGDHGIIDTGIEYTKLKRNNVIVKLPDSNGPWGAGASLEVIDSPAAKHAGIFDAGVNYKDSSPCYCKEI